MLAHSEWSNLQWLLWDSLLAAYIQHMNHQVPNRRLLGENQILVREPGPWIDGWLLPCKSMASEIRSTTHGYVSLLMDFREGSVWSTSVIKEWIFRSEVVHKSEKENHSRFLLLNSSPFAENKKAKQCEWKAKISRSVGICHLSFKCDYSFELNCFTTSLHWSQSPWRWRRFGWTWPHWHETSSRHKICSVMQEFLNLRTTNEFLLEFLRHASKTDFWICHKPMPCNYYFPHAKKGSRKQRFGELSLPNM